MTTNELNNLLESKGFNRSENAYGVVFEKLLCGDELKDYFSLDADALDEIEAGTLKSLFLQIYPENQAVTYIKFDHIDVAQQEIANIHYVEEDDYQGVIDFLQELQN